jgi:nucleoside-diphosphate-sugar epimerase
MAGNVYNLGNDSLNCTKGDLANTIAKDLPCKIVTVDKTDPDGRDYEVSSAKLYKLDWRPKVDLGMGINGLIQYFSMLSTDESVREVQCRPMRNV